MQNIADAAGVSVATVSLCLRNHPRFPVATCKHIQELARKMGYTPNPLVSTLMAHLRSTHPSPYTATIGFIHAFSGHAKGGISATFTAYYNAACQRAEEMGYQLDEFRIWEPGMSTARLNKVLFTRGIVGAIIAPLPAGRGHLSLDWSKLSATAIGLSMWRPNLHRVAHNQFRAMCTVMRQLHRLGYRRIGLTMSANYDERVDHNWLAGLLVYQNQMNNACRVPAFIDKEWTQDSFNQWFQKYRPDVVVAPHITPYMWLGAMGVRIPEDVGFVHLDLTPELGSIAGINQQAEVIGAAAVDAVIDQLHRNERDVPVNPKLALMEGLWREGFTIKKINDGRHLGRPSKKRSVAELEPRP